MLLFYTAAAQQADKAIIGVHVDANKTHQTIRNFAASDAWAGQFVGNWPDEKKNAVADWLFSMDTLANDSPRGIGLSLWRYNLGAGSAEQSSESGIKDEWRRAALTTGDQPIESKKVQAQNWFFQRQKKEAYSNFLVFSIARRCSLQKTAKLLPLKARAISTAIITMPLQITQLKPYNKLKNLRALLLII